MGMIPKISLKNRNIGWQASAKVLKGSSPTLPVRADEIDAGSRGEFPSQCLGKVWSEARVGHAHPGG